MAATKAAVKQLKQDHCDKEKESSQNRFSMLEELESDDDVEETNDTRQETADDEPKIEVKPDAIEETYDINKVNMSALERLLGETCEEALIAEKMCEDKDCELRSMKG